MVSIPDQQQAHRYLEQGRERNPGVWVDHSYMVGEVAGRIAAVHPHLQPERAKVLGMLHDIGRREGVYGLRHTLDGYRFLISEGYEAAARVCLCYPFPVQKPVISRDRWDGSPEDFSFLRQ